MFTKLTVRITIFFPPITARVTQGFSMVSGIDIFMLYPINTASASVGIMKQVVHRMLSAWRCNCKGHKSTITHWCLNKKAHVWQTTFPKAFSCMKMFEFWEMCYQWLRQRQAGIGHPKFNSYEAVIKFNTIPVHDDLVTPEAKSSNTVQALFSGRPSQCSVNLNVRGHFTNRF